MLRKTEPLTHFLCLNSILFNEIIDYLKINRLGDDFNRVLTKLLPQK
jgi:hypothetical protein